MPRSRRPDALSYAGRAGLRSRRRADSVQIACRIRQLFCRRRWRSAGWPETLADRKARKTSAQTSVSTCAISLAFRPGSCHTRRANDLLFDILFSFTGSQHSIQLW